MKSHSRNRCLFCAIANGAIPASIVHEDDAVMAFLDINPIRPGHTQIIPRAHYSYFDALPPELCGRILAVGQRLARILKPAFEVERVGFLFTGGDIPHVHAHVVPLVASDDITSRRYIAEQKVTYRDTPRVSNDELRKTAARLRTLLDAENLS